MSGNGIACKRDPQVLTAPSRNDKRVALGLNSADNRQKTTFFQMMDFVEIPDKLYFKAAGPGPNRTSVDFPDTFLCKVDLIARRGDRFVVHNYRSTEKELGTTAVGIIGHRKRSEG
jgi:hypothetical protein